MSRWTVSRTLVALTIALALVAAATVCVSGAASRVGGGPATGAEPWRLVAEMDDVYKIAFGERGHGWLLTSTYEQEPIGDGRTAAVRRGVWSTDDGGRTWEAGDGRIASSAEWEAPAGSIDRLANPAFLTPLGPRKLVVAFQGVPDYVVEHGTGFMMDAAHAPGGVVMTRDAGRNWTTCLRLPLREVIAASCWTDLRHGWVLSYHRLGDIRYSWVWTLRRTEDEGRSWQEMGQWERPRDANDLVTYPGGLMTMVDRRAGWELFFTPFDEAAFSWTVMCRTSDGGQTWRPVERLPAPGDEDAPGLRYVANPDGFQALARDEVWCWKAMKPMIEGDDSWEGALYHTSDGGQSWQYWDISDPVDWADFVDDQHGWIVTDERDAGEAVLATGDGGTSWQTELSVEGTFWSWLPAGDQVRLVVRVRQSPFEDGVYRLYERSIRD